jgi:hypothetical protein
VKLPVLVALACGLVAAATLEEAARDLARRINGALGPREPHQLQVRAPGQAGDAGLVQRVVAQSLRAPAAGADAADVVITISQNQQTRLLVAEIRRAGAQSVVLIAPYEVAARPPSALVVERRLLWEQQAQILDAVPVEGGLLLLDAAGVFLVSGGAVRQRVDVRDPSPPPRDLRGRLVVRGGEFTAYVGGVRCVGGWRPQLAHACDAAPPEWGLVPGRNWFQVAKLPPVVSAAPLGPNWVAVTTANQARLFSADGATLATLANWGSTVATRPNPCAASAEVVVAATANDRGIEVFDLSGGQPRPLGGSTDFGGVITEMWPSDDSLTVVARSRDRYMAYRVDLGCAR